jgi:hypothetical protein
MSRRLLIAYYAATAVFLSLDLGLDVNVRVAFLEAVPGVRFLYYLICFACLGLMLWRPGWTTVIAAVESLATLVALIINMALRTMFVTDAMLDSGTGFVTMPEIINFVIAGGAAYVAFMHGLSALASRSELR